MGGLASEILNKFYGYNPQRDREKRVSHQLPIVNIGGTDYYRDGRLKEFRAVNNPHQVITFETYREMIER